MQQQPGGIHDAPASNVQASVASLPVTSSPSQPLGNALPQTNPPAQSNPATQTNSAALTNTSVPSNSASNTLSVVPAAASAAPARNSQLSVSPAKGGTTLPASA